jgi:hypothetical protein
MLHPYGSVRSERLIEDDGMSKLLTLFSALKRKVHRVLLEDSDHPLAPESVRAKPRPMIHNANIIKSILSLTGVFMILLVPIIMWLITLPYFGYGYLCFVGTVSVLWIVASIRVRQLNAKDARALGGRGH